MTQPDLLPETSDVIVIKFGQLPELVQRLTREGKFITTLETLPHGYRCHVQRLYRTPNYEHEERTAKA